jgi:hypothetical protein
VRERERGHREIHCVVYLHESCSDIIPYDIYEIFNFLFS